MARDIKAIVPIVIPSMTLFCKNANINIKINKNNLFLTFG